MRTSEDMPAGQAKSDPGPAGPSRTQTVPVNVFEAEGAIVVVAPMAGVMADDVEAIVEPGRLTITASTRTPAPKDYLVHEWHYGPYQREVEIPAGFGEGAQASFGNGQLAVRLPRGVPEARIVVRPGGAEPDISD